MHSNHSFFINPLLLYSTKTKNPLAEFLIVENINIFCRCLHLKFYAFLQSVVIINLNYFHPNWLYRENSRGVATYAKAIIDVDGGTRNCISTPEYYGFLELSASTFTAAGGLLTGLMICILSVRCENV